MSESLFAVNLTDTNLVLKQGYTTIVRGGYIPCTAEDQSHPDFKWAEGRKWLSYTNVEPKVGDLPQIKPIEYFEPNRGMSAEELKAELAKDAQNPQTPGKSEALGNSDTVSGEATVTQLGVEPTEAEPAEGKKSRSKKAAE